MVTKSPRRKKPASTYIHVDQIDVHLWGKFVGRVAQDPKYQAYAFGFSPEFIKTGTEVAPLHMPLRQEPYTFQDLSKETFYGLPAVLADMLPDKFGSALVNKYMAEQGIPASDVTALDRLAYMGERGMGALTFTPTRGPRRTKPTSIVLTDLVTEARRALKGDFQGDEHTNAALRSIIDVGTSAGGARAKAVIAWNSQTEEIRSGQLDAPEGFDQYLLKFDGVGNDLDLGATENYGRIEFAYHLMAREAGIEMTDCRLLEENGRAHFMTRRFDRDSEGRRHHIITLCAMAHVDFKLKGTNSYAQLFQTISALGLPPEQMDEAFRRMILNIFSNNCDDHSKNFSFLLPQDTREWRLAPAYDVTHAYSPTSAWTHQHLMSVNGKFKGIGIDDILEEANRFSTIKRIKRVIDQVRSAVEQWRSFAEQAKLPEAQTQEIADQIDLLY